jgi:hypothetical protein
VIAVSYHDTVNVLQEKKLAMPSPFDRLEYLALLEKLDGKQPEVALARKGDHFAALCLMREGKRLVPLVNWYSFTWRPLLGEGPDRMELITAIARDLSSRTKRIVLAPVPDEDGSANLLQQAFISGGWIVFREKCDTNHVLHVGGRNCEEYMASRPGPLRTTLKRKAKKVDVKILTYFQDDAWNIYEQIYDQSWKPSEGNPAMLRQFAVDEGAAGRLRMAIAWHEGTPVAAQFWTVESGTAYIHKLAHLEEATNLSAGTTLTAALMERVIDGDLVSTVDFGTGNDGYKTDWMDDVRPRFRLDCHRFSNLAGWPQLIKATLRHLASRLQRG